MNQLKYRGTMVGTSIGIPLLSRMSGTKSLGMPQKGQSVLAALTVGVGRPIPFDLLKMNLETGAPDCSILVRFGPEGNGSERM